MKHWYYPSTVVGCGLTISDLRAHELTCLRSEVTCPKCLARLEADKKICSACARGAYFGNYHACDPAEETT